MKNRTIISVILLILVWFFSLFEIYNLSALYKDQIEMGEFFLSIKEPAATLKDYALLKEKALKINALRLLFSGIVICIPIMAVSFAIYSFYKSRIKVRSVKQ